MSHRNNRSGNRNIRYFNPLLKYFFIILVALAVFCIHPATAENIWLKFYREYISAVDGHRCPMHPSCSTYAQQAIEKHGPLIGWIMACDRLARCGRDEMDLSGKIVIQQNIYTHDTVESNDFWWFSPEKKK